MAYTDVELLLAEWLPTVVTGRAVTELPADLAAQVPVHRVTRVGGVDPEPTVDQATVDIESFAATRQEAASAAEDVRHALRFLLPGHLAATGSVARVQTVTAPAWRPYDDTNVRRYGALYQITVHSPSA